MKNLNQWLEEYSVSHKNITNKRIHNICVPLIMFSIIGLISLIPFSIFESTFINWSHILFIPCILFYFMLSKKLAFLITVFNFIPIFIICYFCHFHFLENELYFYLLIFVTSWIGQFIGHKIEGKKPSFFQDITFLLIGPIWVLKNFFNFD